MHPLPLLSPCLQIPQHQPFQVWWKLLVFILILFLSNRIINFLVACVPTQNKDYNSQPSLQLGMAMTPGTGP